MSAHNRKSTSVDQHGSEATGSKTGICILSPAVLARATGGGGTDENQANTIVPYPEPITPWPYPR